MSQKCSELLSPKVVFDDDGSSKAEKFIRFLKHCTYKLCVRVHRILFVDVVASLGLGCVLVAGLFPRMSSGGRLLPLRIGLGVASCIGPACP